MVSVVEGLASATADFLLGTIKNYYFLLLPFVLDVSASIPKKWRDIFRKQRRALRFVTVALVVLATIFTYRDLWVAKVEEAKHYTDQIKLLRQRTDDLNRTISQYTVSMKFLEESRDELKELLKPTLRVTHRQLKKVQDILTFSGIRPKEPPLFERIYRIRVENVGGKAIDNIQVQLKGIIYPEPIGPIEIQPRLLQRANVDGAKYSFKLNPGQYEFVDVVVSCFFAFQPDERLAKQCQGENKTMIRFADPKYGRITLKPGNHQIIILVSGEIGKAVEKIFLIQVDREGNVQSFKEKQ